MIMKKTRIQPKLEYRFGVGGDPLPMRWISWPSPAFRHSENEPFNFSQQIQLLVEDIQARSPMFAHILPKRIFYTHTSARNQSQYGLLARVTPLRLERGKLYQQHKGRMYQAQRYFYHQEEMLYILTFCMPRFYELSFDEKLITVFHELYHMSQAFNGELRLHDGRYKYHSSSKCSYDLLMAKCVREYLANHDQPERFSYFHSTFQQLWNNHGGVYGAVLPRPRLIPME